MDDKPNQKNILAWMAGNPVAANLLMLILIIGGLVTASMITQEVFPEYDLDIVDVSVHYPGASPEEVEKGIILALEEEIRSLDDVERVTAVAEEGRARITVELLSGANANKTLQDIKNGIDRVTSLPDDVERPLISLQTRKREVVRLALYGDIDEWSLFNMADTIREELIDLPEITQVELRGIRQPELSIEVPQKTLRSFGLTLGEIAETVKKRAIDIPAGGIKTPGGEVLLRTTERRDVASEFADLAILSQEDGTEVSLGSIAQINDGYAETDREAYYNGKRAVLIYVYRTGEQTPKDISLAVHRYIDSLTPTLPANIGFAAYNDRSELYQDRLNLLLNNGTLGLLLVLVSLGLFLEPRLAFWVSMGIPISIVGSFILLGFIGGSINMVSMFAFIITLGIVVDDAVVVGENIFHKRQSGLPPLQASIEGVKEMAAPVIIAVATNVIAFLPLLFISGSTGRFFAILPAVVIAVFLISLVECLFILPSHLAYRRKERKGKIFIFLDMIPAYFSKKLERFIATVFSPTLRFALSSRYMVSALSLAILIISYAYWDSGWINFSFRPSIQTDSIDAEIELPYGTNINEVRKIARLVEEGGFRVIEKNGGKDILVGAMTDIGRNGSNTAEITFNLVTQDQRSLTTKEFSTQWRKEVGDIAGLEKLFFDYLVGPGGSAAINVELTHPDPPTLELAATDLAKILSQYNGVTDINDGFAQGKPQFDFKMLPEGQSMGLSTRDLGSQVRHAFYGAEALRQQRGRDEVKVMVRLPESERKSLFHLEQLLILTPDGGEIPLARAALMKKNRAYTEINRVDGKRVINVTANVVPGLANENKILDNLKTEYLPSLLANYSGLKYSFQGRERERRQAVHDLFLGLGFILPAIFCLLAILFRSYSQAVLVMLSIPFGLTSALIGHIIMGYDLSIISIFGMIALCGVVINGGLVFTVTANRLLSAGESPLDAAFNAATRRFRPIMLTAMTTFLGLAPMIFEQSVQARFLVPMAISLGYGILFTTIVILLLMPALWLIYHDVRSWRFSEK
ncbi:MAG: efflux RND transporter permease subunit [Desulfobulbaceae bacterium]|uniref:Efflux RND transporter permease subunit n=1 Tax=Candidatus Desulfobia pelagia TaxID=2841692 RepID=A0A8J6NCS2_9BACT|nr:efflux RND transporter permease subunit [Candidatus Desulfobia pelagia]